MTGSHILVVDDEADIRGLLKEILSEEGYEVDVAANAAQARASRARQVPDLVLLDIWMPDVDGITLLREWSVGAADGCPVVMMSGHSTVETAVEATRLGAFDFVEKPLSLAKLLRTVERALDAGRRHRQSGKFLGAPLAIPVGKSRVMQQLRAELQQIASNPSPVLLVGEPGSGREAFARYLHEHGPRANAPFVPLVASSLREADAEARLFGREESDGTKVPGVLEEAGNGTLFIHEVEDLPRGRAAPAGRGVRVRTVHPHRRARVGAVSTPGSCPRRSRGSSSAPGARCCGAICWPTSTCSSCACRRCASTPRTCPSCCATRSIAWWMPTACRSGASASRRRTACATTRGRTTCASCGTSCTGC